MYRIMKELSIKQKAKAYDKALKEAVIAHKDEDRHLKATLERIFPELAESENEKIRKELIQFIKNWKDSNNIGCPHDFPMFTKNVEQCDKYLAWLEKQGKQKVSYTTIVETGDGGINALVTRELPIDGCDGKQKPIDNVETKDYSSIDPHFGKPIDKQKPKFHEGDWVILFEHNDSIYQVERIDNYRYYLRHYSGYTISPHFDRESIRLWTIKDAKPGDVLYSQKHNLIWIYKDNKHYYASINLNYADGISFDGDIVIPSDVCPATKEQRDLLFQKIDWL